jgi:hypothetical protein
VIDRGTGGPTDGFSPVDNIVERHQQWLAGELRGGDLVGRGQKVIGGRHDHRRLVVQRDDGQPGRVRG